AGNNAKAARSLKRGKAGLVQVRIVGIAAGTPTGTVTLKAGAKTLGKAKVKKSGKKYVATIKVKAKATRKIKKTTKIKVVYSGNANLAKLTAKTKLRVVR
ncbi:Ig-like domain-containing protein, partial [Rarobacter faecitabidus]